MLLLSHVSRNGNGNGNPFFLSFALLRVTSFFTIGYPLPARDFWMDPPFGGKPMTQTKTGRKFAALPRIPLFLVPQDVFTVPDGHRGQIDGGCGELV